MITRNNQAAAPYTAAATDDAQTAEQRIRMEGSNAYRVSNPFP